MNRVVVPLLCLVVLTACGVSRTVPTTSGPAISEAALLDTILRSQNHGAFQGTGSLTIETEEKGQRLSCKINYNGSDTIKLEVNTGFGYGLLSIWLTPDSLFISNRISGQFVSTNYRSNELQQLLSFPLTFQDVQALFLGQIILHPQSRLVSVMNEPAEMVYVFRNPDGGEKIRVDKEISKPVRITRNNRRGESVLDIQLQRYKDVGTTRLAHQIQIYRPGDQEKVSLYFTSLNPVEQLVLPVIIPSGLERIRL